MIANYHSHTWRCNHAGGTEEEYVQAAIFAGMKELGFSDHSPYLFPDGYYSTFRMKPDQLADYAKTILELKEKYRDQIQIHLGLEMEYYPAFFADTVSFARDNGIEYLILGQHHIGNEINDPYAYYPTEDLSILTRYADQSIEALGTGLYSYFAHPDLISYVGDPKQYEVHIRRICRAAKEMGIPLELNLLGLGEDRRYPNPRFWAVAAEEGCDVVFGCDAHQPQALLDTATEENALAFIKEYGLHLLHSIQLHKI